MISLPAKSAIARALPSFGSRRNTSARSLVPNHTPPSLATVTAVTRLSSVSNASRAAPPLMEYSLPDGPVPAYSVSPAAASDQIVSTSLSCGPAVAVPLATSIRHTLSPGIAPAHTAPSEVCASATIAIAPGTATSFLAPASGGAVDRAARVGAEQDRAVGEPEL